MVVRSGWASNRPCRNHRICGTWTLSSAMTRPESCANSSASRHSAPETATRVASLLRSEEHTSELQSLMRISYAVFCLKKNKHKPSHRDQTTANTPNTIAQRIQQITYHNNNITTT